MNLSDVRTLVQAMGERQTAQPLLLAGTVMEVSDSGVLLIAMDGDPENTEIEVTTLTPGVSSGDRVMVFFDPPRGVYAIGALNRVVDAGQVIGHVKRAYDDAEPFEEPDITPQASLRAVFTGGRIYRFDLTATFSRVDNGAFSWMYVQALNQRINDTQAQFFPFFEDFLIGTSVDDLEYHTASAFRIVECRESTVETLDVYLYMGGAEEYEGEFELAITDVGPVLQ